MSTDETKLKVISKIDAIFRQQERVLTQSTETFDYEGAVKQLRQNMHSFGAPEYHRAVI